MSITLGLTAALAACSGTQRESPGADRVDPAHATTATAAVETKATDTKADPAKAADPAATEPTTARVLAAGKPCRATSECGAGLRCTTDDGACDRPPGCGPSDLCAAVCYGLCTPKTTAQLVPKEVVPPATGAKGAACKSDADCVLFSNYCTGCDCRALGRDEGTPKCAGPGVRCLVDPCMKRHAACVEGRCSVSLGAPRE